MSDGELFIYYAKPRTFVSMRKPEPGRPTRIIATSEICGQVFGARGSSLCVVVKTLSRFSAQPSGIDIFFQKGARTVFGITQTLV